jgi:hypothetical protein
MLASEYYSLARLLHEYVNLVGEKSIVRGQWFRSRLQPLSPEFSVFTFDAPTKFISIIRNGLDIHSLGIETPCTSTW